MLISTKCGFGAKSSPLRLFCSGTSVILKHHQFAHGFCPHIIKHPPRGSPTLGSVFYSLVRLSLFSPSSFRSFGLRLSQSISTRSGLTVSSSHKNTRLMRGSLPFSVVYNSALPFLHQGNSGLQQQSGTSTAAYHQCIWPSFPSGAWVATTMLSSLLYLRYPLLSFFSVLSFRVRVNLSCVM